MCQLDTYQGYLWPKFQLNRMFITGVFVQNPPQNWAQLGHEAKKIGVI